MLTEEHCDRLEAKARNCRDNARAERLIARCGMTKSGLKILERLTVPVGGAR